MIRPFTLSLFRFRYLLCISFFSVVCLAQMLVAAPPNLKPSLKKKNQDNKKIPQFYPDLKTIYREMDSLQQAFPELLKKEQIGMSSTKAQPIFAIKLSDNAARTEDEPALLFSSLHHAREAIGGLFLLHFIGEMAMSYQHDPLVKELIDNLSIWVVPVVNPDGYEYMFEKTPVFPWWRKNIRNYYANERNMSLGVDLNRNYNYNWKQGGESSPSSWYYRGQSPASESEVQTM